MRLRPISAVVLACAVLAGCTSDDEAPPAPAAVAPYPGPLVLPADAPRKALNRGGAARAVLRCAVEFGGGSGTNADASGLLEGAGTPEGAVPEFLTDYFGARLIPESGYRRAAERDGRILFVYEVESRPVVAAIVREDRDPDTYPDGWLVDSIAWCDAADLPPGAVTDPDTQVWTDVEGRRVSTRRITSFAGPGHCDWTTVTFLELERGRRQYLRDPGGELADYLRVPFQGSANLPGDATDTGFRREGAALWVAKDAAYVVRGDSVEVWPRTTRLVRCA